jgi:tetratricopeptide (TPR) repeat protein
LEQWPNDRRARLRLALLTAFRLAASPGDEGVEPALAEALALAFAAAPQRDRPSPLTLNTTLTWLRHASARDIRYSDVADVMTAYGRIALQCEELDMAIEILEALYEILGEPRQAYHLAKSYQARSQQAVSESAAWDDCKRAIALAQQALESELHGAYATVLLEQLEADQARLAAAQRPEIPERNPQPDHPDNVTERQVMPVSAFPPEVRVSQDRFSFLLGLWWRLKRGWLRKSK